MRSAAGVGLKVYYATSNGTVFPYRAVQSPVPLGVGRRTPSRLLFYDSD
jgi:hypothetical protein